MEGRELTLNQGRGFEVGEKVPFRLTHNIIDGMGVTGVEGTLALPPWAES